MCVFCEIINGNIPSSTIYEDDIVKCFLDMNQDCLGHILIVPKVHTLDIDTIDEDTLKHILKIDRMLKKRLEDRLHIDGLTHLQNNGIAEEVKHFHIHLIPKYINKPKDMSMKDLENLLK